MRRLCERVQLIYKKWERDAYGERREVGRNGFQQAWGRGIVPVTRLFLDPVTRLFLDSPVLSRLTRAGESRTGETRNILWPQIDCVRTFANIHTCKFPPHRRTSHLHANTFTHSCMPATPPYRCLLACTRPSNPFKKLGRVLYVDVTCSGGP